MTISNTSTLAAPGSLSRRTTATVTLTLGLLIVFGVGFAQGSNDVIHNAAHDTRHTLVFPCH
ncbi:hypothetical protein MNBD_GAMMA13-541 [hydrothermal vent metagenome]|uniref:Cobalt transporter subunit CbtB (Proposed) n=1 Tax=hydrothermal vent metagenome TaxID=652676 RepID=A0A3B0Y5Z2_9ZZZZ